MAVVVVLSVMLIATHSAAGLLLGRLNTALKRGDWVTADRLQVLWKHAAPSAVRGALLQAVWSHDYSRAHAILTRCPPIRLDSFVRQQVGDYSAEIINAGDWSRHRPISPALEDPVMLITLLDNGANVNTTLAEDYGDPARTLLGILLSRRARITEPQLISKSLEMERILRNRGARLSLFDAARFGDIPELREQFTHGADPNAVDWVGRRLLYLAALNNQIDAARLLLRHGAEIDVSSGGTKGLAHDTPLMVAERKGHVQLAELLINSGAITHHESKSDTGFAAIPVIPAAAFGNVDHIRFLLAHGAHLNARTPGGSTALMFACLESDVSAPVPPPQTEKSRDDRAERQSAVLDLLIHAGCKVNERDNSGRTALMQAVWSERLVQKLIANGAAVNLTDNSGSSALMEAVRSSNQDVVSLLLASGANVNMETMDGVSALGIALDDKYDTTSTALSRDAHRDVNCGAIVAEMRKYGAHLSLREAALTGNASEFKWGMTHDASLDVYTRGKAPLLMSAVHGGNIEIVKMLLKSRAKVNAVNSRGWTALMVATGDGRKDLVKLMLEYGARKDLRTIGGQNVVEIARHYNHDELLPILH